MHSSVNRLSAALLAALIFCAAAAAPALAQGDDKPDAKQETARQDEAVTEKGFRGRIFELKHRSPDSLYGVLRPLGSGFRGATVSVNREFRTITVRDFPENLAVMEEAIKRLDTPEPARPDIEFRVHILIATNNPQQFVAPNDMPAELNGVVKQLQTTLSYKAYRLMTSQAVRAKEGPGTIGNKGVAELSLSPSTAAREHPIFYEYRMSQVSLEAPANGPWKAQIANFNFAMRIPLSSGSTGNSPPVYESVGFNTPVGIREGEKVVVGTTTMQDKGIVIVLVANVVK